MAEWRKVCLGDITVDVTVGYVGTMANEYRDSGVPFLRSQNVRPHRIDLDDVKYIDQEFHGRLRKSQLRPGDVVTVRTGKPGQTAIIPDSVQVANCSDLVIIRPGSELNGRWLSYYLNWVTESHIAGHLVGAVQQHFNVNSAKNLQISLPSLGEQWGIAEVLGALDDKIAANNRLLQVSDQLCAAEVLKASSVGKWCRLRELLTLHYGKALPASQRCAGDVIVYGSGGRVGTHSIALVNRRGIVLGRKGTVGAVYWADGPHYPIDTTYYAESLDPDTDEVLYYTLRTMKLEQLNSDSAVPGLNRDEAYAQQVRVPAAETRKTLSASLRSRFLWMAAVRYESSKLAVTRDELLPLLMAGRVHVKDAEKVVGEVV